MFFIKKLITAILLWEARLVLKRYKPFIIAVTGSVGKTSTKDAIFDVLKSPATCKVDGTGICHVRKSEKSMNSEIGLPLTILGVPNAWYSISGWVANICAGIELLFAAKARAQYPDCLVLEIGADHPGDIKSVTRWLKPDIAVITKVSKTPVHVEFFSSPEEVFEEKAALARNVKPTGTLVLFADDQNVAGLEPEAAARGVRVITFGTIAGATVRGSDLAISYDAERRPAGISFSLEAEGRRAAVSVPRIAGMSFIFPLLAAAAVGHARDIALSEIARSLAAYDAPRGRMNIVPGINGSTLIDDTYNSSPDAASAALATLRATETGAPDARKIAVLGDMMELGKYAADEHRSIGREAASALSTGAHGRPHLLVTVGPRSQATADEALKHGLSPEAVIACASAAEAAERLAPLVGTGDVVLIKGSQSMRMERIVGALMREPARAPELLVRQEKEWLEKK